MINNYIQDRTDGMWTTTGLWRDMFARSCRRRQHGSAIATTTTIRGRAVVVVSIVVVVAVVGHAQKRTTSNDKFVMDFKNKWNEAKWRQCVRVEKDWNDIF